MPRKMWKHVCTGSTAEMWEGVPVCTTCGQAGQYDGWHYNVHEVRLAYQDSTGLKPAGDHRPLADELLTPYREPCQTCQGKGVLDSADGASYTYCPDCHGDCVVWTCSPEEKARLIRQITDAFPDAAIGDTDVGT
jgi:DnaJ-class molecular chaperone